MLVPYVPLMLASAVFILMFVWLQRRIDWHLITITVVSFAVVTSLFLLLFVPVTIRGLIGWFVALVWMVLVPFIQRVEDVRQAKRRLEALRKGDESGTWITAAEDEQPFKQDGLPM